MKTDHRSIFLNRIKLSAAARAFLPVLCCAVLLSATFESTPARLIPLAKRSIDGLIRTQGIGDLFRLYVTARTYNFDYFLAHVPNDYHVATNELFDPDYMRPLFQIGYQQGLKGGCWRSAPPGLTTTAGDSGKNDAAGCTPGVERGD